MMSRHKCSLMIVLDGGCAEKRYSARETAAKHEGI
jgi:hypothetical protein